MIGSGTVHLLAQIGTIPDDAASGASLLAPMLMVIGVVALGFLLILSVRGKVARRQAATPSARERIDQLKKRTGAGSALGGGDDAYAINARLLDTAQSLSARLDAKAERLEQLIERVDERIAVLQTMTEGTTRSNATSGWPARSTEPGAEPDGRSGVAPTEPSDPLTIEVYGLSDAGHDSVEIAQRLDEQVGKVELILALRGDRGA